MALNFPNDPSEGDTYEGYVWNDTVGAWQSTQAGGGSIDASSNPPASPSSGDLWWDTDDGKLYIYYDDGTSQQWVDAAGPSVAVQDTAPTGYQGQLWLDSTDGSMYVYYTDPGGVNSQWIGAVSRSGGILQVVSTTKTDTFSTTSTSFTDVTGLTATITPRSTSSKILVVASVETSQTGADGVTSYTRLAGGNTGSYLGDTASNRVRTVSMTATRGAFNSGLSLMSQSLTYLDSPNTTSSTTYSVQMRVNSNTGYVNRTPDDTDTTQFGRGASTITLYEVAG